MIRAMLPHAEPRRLAAVERYAVLDAPRDTTFDRIAEVAALVFGAPMASVTVVDADRVCFLGAHGLDGVAEIGVEPGLCVSAVLREGPYVVGDAAADPRTADHPMVRGEPGLRFYAAAPIVTADGHRLGTVNAMDRQPREADGARTSALTGLAAIAADRLELRLAAIQAVRTARGLDAPAREEHAASTEQAEHLRRIAADHRTGEHPITCRLGNPDPCGRPAELKVADPWGDSAWGCVEHAEHVILTVRSTFVADKALSGLAAYLRGIGRACVDSTVDVTPPS